MDISEKFRIFMIQLTDHMRLNKDGQSMDTLIPLRRRNKIIIGKREFWNWVGEGRGRERRVGSLTAGGKREAYRDQRMNRCATQWFGGHGETVEVSDTRDKRSSQNPMGMTFSEMSSCGEEEPKEATSSR